MITNLTRRNDSEFVRKDALVTTGELLSAIGRNDIVCGACTFSPTETARPLRRSDDGLGAAHEGAFNTKSRPYIDNLSFTAVPSERVADGCWTISTNRFWLKARHSYNWQPLA
ncbi:uncharacterized protein CLUP02_10787 [Colletotrichum lupini]|uniref:Uncharacterized protein n=1 Tax=Colletotrichum lupini TaxID=145971 RepID=A0A9Q8SXL3_9PEZI|nr:uncharacterized protein CLUP02_10787 [Colletotrichum lupini]UQC85290.1 hypothetical protein CLUP02_10787 [Colletotrichum lupini]